MNLSKDCIKKLKEWVGSDTWHSTHDNDMKKFYLFVNSYQNDHGYSINDESMLAEIIAQHAGVNANSTLHDAIQDRIALMYNILDYIKLTS